ncbi:MAG: sugar-binding domain-containing protein [Planctomycetota bacterium]
MAGASEADNQNIISLAGQWSFRLDPDKKGIDEKWYASALPEKVKLPGTTDENRKGAKNDKRMWGYLSRLYIYTGPAWYQREVEIPNSWAGKRVTLLLERSKSTRVWVDDKFIGSFNSFSVPHVYDLTSAITPGKHQLTVQVDNADHPPMGNSHAITEHTQTNWNGIVGKIQLQATDPVRIKEIKVYPNISNKTAAVHVIVDNDKKLHIKGKLRLSAQCYNSDKKHSPAPETTSITTSSRSTAFRVNYNLDADALLWDEFSPALYKLTVTLDTKAGNQQFQDSRTVTFGMREFTTKGTQFAINGRTTFLRGKVDNCVFPLTAYAPMDKASWLRVFKIAKSYGINHYRFHSWCPPEAAFDAADELGIYLQPELPTWYVFGGTQHDQFMEPEGYGILAAYGNHPSFVMFSLGNELRGNRKVMAKFVSGFRDKDPRHLYAQGSNNFFDNPSLAEGDDYWTTFMTSGVWKGVTDKHRYGAFVRGSYDQHTRGHINNQSPSTMVDYRESLAGIPVPVIGHEIASYEVYPNFKEIEKYTGVLRARNFEVFRERLEAKHMLDQADDFFRASGALSVICHREEVEAALRTPGFGGFQMLDLQDFPGQGTALVGMLDAFMDSKGLITPEAWREFCSPTVPLLLMPKYTWTTDEVFTAEVKVAHYGSEKLKDAELLYTVSNQRRQIASSQLFAVDVGQGGITKMGKIFFLLSAINAPQKITLEIKIRDTDFVNHYDIWVYPEKVDTTPAEGITISRTLDKAARGLLSAGGKVLLLPELDKLTNSVGGAFQTNFWCYPYFKKYNPPGTLGILCDPRHPALKHFPTEFHSNWQWWHLVKTARPIILDNTPPDYRPIVQVIDNFERNHKMGIIFEAKVGKGKLLICSSDLLGLKDRPEARQMLHSLLAYMASSSFKPATEIDLGFVSE